MERFSLVAQTDEWGCGVACVASFLGISYSTASELLRKHKNGKTVNQTPKGLELHHIALALQDYGYRVVADWKEPKKFVQGTIVCIAGEKPYDGHHYMLKTRNGWMDPWLNIGKKPRKAGFRKKYPDGTEFLVALIPKT
ncbi:hypothetical protein GBN33_03095 [Plesiomonas shigelloides]|uniref:cysteine peptidase family C39 domain-containing protein n=1 Tax=Plesiomonas shigelloides TaxID=703 RepID=UPI0012621484|nr:cysteine peptidase family C39 domain-containing protein [Plesiomonas shigelloides]KAB7702100.1 hypothetical protein GBN33_03095 [Plesiomonas shigelloides]